jgi:predicted transcriptional regulator
MKRIMVQLTEEQIKALQELAKARKTSVARLVRESVAQYVVVTDKDVKREEARRRALEFIRKIKSGEIQFHDKDGATDVSVNHDKYLAEIYGTWKTS